MNVQFRINHSSNNTEILADGHEVGLIYTHSVYRHREGAALVSELFAHGYPALLEAAEQYFECLGQPNSHDREKAKRGAAYESMVRYIALYDAMKACEPPAPPKKTREDVLRDVFRWLGGLDDDENVDINTLTHKTLRELDEAGD